MPDFFIIEYEEKEFDSFEFYDSARNPVKVEGRKFYVRYKIKEGVKAPSDLQVIRNYTNAIRKIGGSVLEDRYQAYMKLKKDAMEIWVAIYGETGETYSLHIVEKAELAQEVTANAAYFAENISQTGHIAVYGLYFDTGKAEVKPESEPTLKEIAVLLGQNPSLKLNVVGHTDTVGDFGFNLKLSQARADSVVKILTSNYGIDVSRLAAYGVGSLAPVASNKTEEGRAKNRRVELVER
jgi:outer membrane protein OmpA-like peptidoglycan-associated protein